MIAKTRDPSFHDTVNDCPDRNIPQRERAGGNQSVEWPSNDRSIQGVDSDLLTGY